MSIRFLLDEHIDHAVRRELIRHEPTIDVKVIGSIDQENFLTRLRLFKIGQRFYE